MPKFTVIPDTGYNEFSLLEQVGSIGPRKANPVEKDSDSYLFKLSSKISVEAVGSFDVAEDSGFAKTVNIYQNGVLVLQVTDLVISLDEFRLGITFGFDQLFSAFQDRQPSQTFGNKGDDILVSFHSGSLFGRAGNDTLYEFTGNKTKFDGETGTDTVNYSTVFNDENLGVGVNLLDSTKNTGEAKRDSYVSIENVVGTIYDDKITGNDRKNVLTGGLGADKLEGGDGVDTANYAGATAGITLNLANPAANTGEAAGDRLKNIEIVIGTSLADTLIGDENNNTFFGGGGDDILDGGLGIDTLWGDTKATGVDNADTFVFNNPASGVKNIMDYDVFDHIQVSREGFGLHPLYKITAGLTLIVAENDPVVSTNSPTFLFETSSGELRFDQDGNGSGGSVLIATIRFNSQQTLDVNDIVIV